MRIESRHGAVEIVEQTLTGKFVVTGSSGYRAELTACLFDLCVGGERVSCAKPLTTHYGFQHAVNGKSSVDAWLKHCETHCHGWHWPKIEAFAREVLATYGAKPARSKATVGMPRGSVYAAFVGVGYVHRDALLRANMTPKADREAQVKAWSTLISD